MEQREQVLVPDPRTAANTLRDSAAQWNFRPPAPFWRYIWRFYCLFYRYRLCRFGRFFAPASLLFCFASSHQCRLVVCIVVLIRFLSTILKNHYMRTFKHHNFINTKAFLGLKKLTKLIYSMIHHSQPVSVFQNHVFTLK